MWQILVQDTSFWTTYYFFVGATLTMSLSLWQAISCVYLYTSLEFIIGSAFQYNPDPVLTLFAYKVAVLIGAVFGPFIQPKAPPLYIISLIPGLALYADPIAQYGVAVFIVAAALYMKYYRWAAFCTCVSTAAILLPMKIAAAPLVGLSVPVVFGFLYSAI